MPKVILSLPLLKGNFTKTAFQIADKIATFWELDKTEVANALNTAAAQGLPEFQAAYDKYFSEEIKLILE